MVDKALLDTDTISEIGKAIDHTVVAAANHYLTFHPCFTISTVTVMEVVRGYHLAGRREKLASFLESLREQELLAFMPSTAELAGEIDAALLRSGQRIGRADPMIAATAIEHELTLVTGNTEHFARIPALGFSLKLSNWRIAVGAQ
jgi:tRNA(fMet)-specific endonuclease VapC